MASFVMGSDHAHSMSNVNAARMTFTMHNALMTGRRTPEDERYGARLIQAREHAGFATATEAVREMNRLKGKAPKVVQSTYDNHEDGHRLPHWTVTKRYAAFYGVRPLWLAFDDGPMLEADPALNEAQRLLNGLQEPFKSIAMDSLRSLARQQDKE
jgi:hypothetical protein